MATIETKYSIGDVVYFANTTTERKQHACPDCKGERVWKAISPAGTEYSFRCPRCAASYQSNDKLSLYYTAHIPLVSRYTIGSVRYDSAGGWPNRLAQNQYMCNETGVGGGSVYDEDRLFESEEAALTSAIAIANKANAENKWIVELYNKTLEISDYQLEHALIKAAKEEESRAQSMLWNLGDLFERIGEAEGKDDILEAIDDYKKYDWERDKERAAEAIEPLAAPSLPTLPADASTALAPGSGEGAVSGAEGEG